MPATIGLPGKLRTLSVAMLERALSDWTAMCGVETAVTDASVKSYSSPDEMAAELEKNLVVVQTKLEGPADGPTYFAFPAELVAHAIAHFVMLPPEAIAQKVSEGLDEGDFEAFQELANMFCGSSNNVLAASHEGMRLSQAVDALLVHRPDEGDADRFADLPSGSIATIAVEVTLDGVKGTLDHVIPVDVARAFLANA